MGVTIPFKNETYLHTAYPKLLAKESWLSKNQSAKIIFLAVFIGAKPIAFKNLAMNISV